MAHVGDAIDCHRVGRRILLNPYTPGSQIGNSRVDVRYPPCHLGLQIRSADCAEGHHELRSGTGSKDNPITWIFTQYLEAKFVAIEGSCGVEVSG